MKNVVAAFICGISCVVFARDARAQSSPERLCDASWENCRTPLLSLINNEQIRIDVGVWFFKDDRYVTALINAFNRGVRVRVLMDTRANDTYTQNAYELDRLKNAGIPMRRRTAGDILHWKLMVFTQQRMVEWSGANFSPTAFVPQDPYKDYEDEVIYFSQRLVDSFFTIFDNIWTNTTDYANYANISGSLTRAHPTSPIDPRLNFPPQNSYESRLIPLIDKEPAGGLIDVDMYRVTMHDPVDALIRAAARGVRMRLYFEPNEYANTARPGNKTQMDRLVAASQQYPNRIEIRMRAHLGLNHQKTVWLHTEHIVVFGTSNWSDASDDNQLEANIFTDVDPGDGLNDFLYSELHKIFVRKFYNENPIGATETTAWRTAALSPRPTDDDASVPPPPPPQPSDAPDVIMWASSAARHGTWQLLDDTTAAGGSAVWNPNANAGKISPALASPANYFELSFSAQANTAYHLWVRLRAEGNSMSNDSVHVQFSDSMTAAGAATQRIGTTSSAEIVLQDGSGDSSIHNWGWADNGWGAAGVPIYFAATGTHTVRVQQREDGAIVDQIVLSANTYLNTAPGPRDDDATTLTPTDGTGGGSGGSGGSTGVLPSGWTSSDIGLVGQTGDAGESGGTFTISGSGADIWGTADAFRFAYEPLAGDGTIVARVASVENVNAWTKAGVMIRQTLDPGSPHASLFVTPAKGVAFQRRPTADGTSLNTQVSGAAPFWVRLVRAAQVVTASVSADGTSWTDVGQETIDLTGAVYAGLAVTSHDNSQIATATFDHVAITADAGSGGSGGSTADVVLHPSAAPTIAGDWAVNADSTAATGASLLNPDRGAAKIITASATPVSYFEMTFDAQAGMPYHLWIRGKATNDSWANDSVFAQFSDSVDAGGNALYRIGTTDGTRVNLEDCSGCGLRGWGWQDNGYGAGVMGPNVYFMTSGIHTIRIQVSEDGLAIDQIVLSPSTYLNQSPGALKNDSTIVP